MTTTPKKRSKPKKIENGIEEDIKLSPFDILNRLNSGKPYAWEEIKDVFKGSFYIIYKSLSYFPDTVSIADDMNRLNHIPPEVQYEYLINTIRPKKRFSAWAKKDTTDIDIVRKAFGYNYQKAEAALKILTPEQINMLKKKQETGGIK